MESSRDGGSTQGRAVSAHTTNATVPASNNSHITRRASTLRRSTRAPRRAASAWSSGGTRGGDCSSIRRTVASRLIRVTTAPP
ncbi:hypothetical protein GCM10023238_35210 [Streptomyces heliomycini]